MSTERGVSDDLWSEITIRKSEDEHLQQNVVNQINVVYRRRKTGEPAVVLQPSQSSIIPRADFTKAKRIGWDRSLCTRGRTSIELQNIHPTKEQTKKAKQGKKKSRPCPPNFETERAYFKEVDATELYEESPSPKHFGNWAMHMHDESTLGELASILERWRISKNAFGGGTPRYVFDVTEIPVLDSCSSNHLDTSIEKAQSRSYEECISSKILEESSTPQSSESCLANALDALKITQGSSDLLEKDSSPLLDTENGDAFSQLMMVCKQSKPLSLPCAFEQFCDISSVSKVGEGTYGEVFEAGENICKIVPIDGSSLVNGEVQKRSDEVLEEVLLCLTLNKLRGLDGDISNQNVCTSFIETRNLRVCQGGYGDTLISAWEEWDAKHGSENDNPREFPEMQCYIMFVLAYGGTDLENFLLSNGNEAHSLLTQVTAALAVAEVAFEFEHRDLHWGNILLVRTEAPTVDFIIQGRTIKCRTYGLVVSIIDFTLSRLNTGQSVRYFDLSSDPEIFEGPKRDIQFDTYRKMKNVTEECWEGSFPKTNVLWLEYLVDILLLKKSYKRTAKEAGNFRSFKKRLASYGSSKEALSDPFFSDIFVDPPV